MNATSSTLGQGSYTTLPPSLTERLSRALHWPAAIVLMRKTIACLQPNGSRHGPLRTKLSV